MSALAMLDATSICSRSSDRLTDPSAWLMAPGPVSVPGPRPTARAEVPVRYSWWTLLRNPHALMVTGLVSPLAARDAVLKRVSIRRSAVPL
jgi:hypothetical protein